MGSIHTRRWSGSTMMPSRPTRRTSQNPAAEFRGRDWVCQSWLARAISAIGSTVRPVSSRNSRTSASVSLSPGSTPPPGRSYS